MNLVIAFFVELTVSLETVLLLSDFVDAVRVIAAIRATLIPFIIWHQFIQTKQQIDNKHNNNYH